MLPAGFPGKKTAIQLEGTATIGLLWLWVGASKGPCVAPDPPPGVKEQVRQFGLRAGFAAAHKHEEINLFLSFQGVGIPVL